MLEEVILAPQAAKRLLEPAEVAGTVAYLLGPGGAPSPAPPSRWTWGGALAEPPSNEAVDLPALEALWGFNHPESEKIPPQEGANSRRASTVVTTHWPVRPGCRRESPWLW